MYAHTPCTVSELIKITPRLITTMRAGCGHGEIIKLHNSPKKILEPVTKRMHVGYRLVHSAAADLVQVAAQPRQSIRHLRYALPNKYHCSAEAVPKFGPSHLVELHMKRNLTQQADEMSIQTGRARAVPRQLRVGMIRLFMVCEHTNRKNTVLLLSSGKHDCGQWSDGQHHTRPLPVHMPHINSSAMIIPRIRALHYCLS